MFKKDGCLKMDKSPHSPHQIIPSLINNDSSVLDVGCNTGYLGKLLKKKKVVIDGVDIDTKALRIARKYYHQTYKRDLYYKRLSLNKKYDYIVMADILEHLPRPDLLLKDCKNYLKKSGQIIISVPNIARLEIRIKLMLGKFEYGRGILSEDHLRFFTRDSAIKMINRCGYKVMEIIPTGLGHKLRIISSLTAFQFIFICRAT
jgi:2-polyprenyl-3-methyl-5-hydroxy-6-metoxy-1,4-benzoquinol methylase